MEVEPDSQEHEKTDRHQKRLANRPVGAGVFIERRKLLIDGKPPLDEPPRREKCLESVLIRRTTHPIIFTNMPAVPMNCFACLVIALP
jgi:hypothetical protein